MPQEAYYRFFSHSAEFNQLQRDRVVHTTNPHGRGEPWFTPTRFEDPVDAQRLLALQRTPQFRVGPIPADEMPDFDVCGPRRIQPAYGQPGGAVEVCTTMPVFIFGCYNFGSRDWEPL